MRCSIFNDFKSIISSLIQSSTNLDSIYNQIEDNVKKEINNQSSSKKIDIYDKLSKLSKIDNLLS